MTQPGKARPKAPREQFFRSVSMIDVASEILLDNAPAVRSDIKRGEWIEFLTAARDRINETLRLLEKP